MARFSWRQAATPGARHASASSGRWPTLYWRSAAALAFSCAVVGLLAA